MRKQRGWIALLLTAALCFLAWPALADDPPEIDIRLNEDLAVYARNRAYIDLANFDWPGAEDGQAPVIQYCLSGRDMDYSSIRAGDWVSYEYYYDDGVYLKPSQDRENEAGYLYVRAKNGEEWVYARKSLYFTALESLPRDDSMRISLPGEEASVLTDGSFTVQLEGSGLWDGCLSDSIGSWFSLDSTGKRIYSLQAGGDAGEAGLCMLAQKNGSQIRSNVIWLNVGELGLTAEPRYEVTSAGEIPLNGTFDLVIASDPHTRSYDVAVYDGDRRLIGFVRAETTGGADRLPVSVPFTGGRPGDVCSAVITAVGEEGYRSAVLEGREDLTFTLTEPSWLDGEPRIRVLYLPESCETDVWLKTTVTARGADSVRVEILEGAEQSDSGYWEQWLSGSDILEGEFLATEAGTYTLQVTAEFADGTFRESREISARGFVMPDPGFELPLFLVRDQTAALRFPMPDWMRELSVRVYCEDEEGGRDWSYRNENAAEIEITPGMTGGAAVVRVSADYFVGDHEGYLYQPIPVLDAGPDSRVTLTADRTDVPINSRVKLTVSAPGADAARMWWDGEFRPAADGDVITMDISRQGSFTAFLEADYGGEKRYSQPVVINGVSGGICPKPLNYQLEGLTDGKISRDAVLSVRIPGSDDFSSYTVILYDETHRWLADRSAQTDPEKDILLQFPMLIVPAEAESAYVTILADPVGYDSLTVRSASFTVTELSMEPENGIYATIPETSLTGEKVYFAVYAPGASLVGVDTGFFSALTGGQSYSSRFTQENTPGIYEVRIWAETDGEIREIFRRIRAEAPYGDLRLDTGSLPAYLEPGTDAELTLPVPEEAERLEIRAEIETEDGPLELNSEWDGFSPWSCRIPGSLLTEGSRVVLSVDASDSRIRAGYAAVQTEIIIPVCGEPDDGIRVTMPDGPVPLGAEFGITVSAPGARQVQIRLCDSDSGWKMTDGEGRAAFRESAPSEAGRYTCYVAADYGGEIRYSRPVSYEVKSFGSYPEPLRFELEGLNENGHAVPGRPLKLKVSAAEDAETRFGVYLEDSEGNWISDEQSIVPAGETHTFELGTLLLPEEDTCQISVSRTIAGYRYDSRTITLRTEAIGAAPENGIYVFVPETVLTDDYDGTLFQVYAPGADQIDVDFSSGNGASVYGERMTVHESFRYAGTFSMTIRAEIAGEIHELRKEFRVLAPYGPVQPDLSGIPTFFTPGKDAKLMFTPPEGCLEYETEINRVSRDESENPVRTRILESSWQTEVWQGTIPGAQISAGESWEIWLSVSPKPGYEGVTYLWSVPVIERISETVTLTAEETRVLTGTTVNFHAEAPGAKRITIYGPEESQTFSGTDSADWACPVPRDRRTALCYAEADYGGETAVSLPLMIETWSRGEYSEPLAPRFDIPEDGMISRDRSLTVSVEAIGADAEYEISLEHFLSENGGMKETVWSETRTAAAGQEFTAVIPLLARNAGDICNLSVRRNLAGYHAAYAESPSFEVTELAAPLTDGMYVEFPDRALTNADIPYGICAPGADRVGISEAGGDEYASAEADVLTGSVRRTGAETLEWVFWAEFGGERREISGICRVEAPKGPARADLSRLPDYVIRNGSSAALDFGLAPDADETVRYQYEVMLRTSDETVYYEYGDFTHEDTSVTIPADDLTDVSSIYVELRARGVGYSETVDSLTIPVADWFEDSITLTADNPAPLYGQTVNLTLSADQPMEEYELTGDFYSRGPLDGAREAVIQVSASKLSVSTVCVRVRLAGDPTWYTAGPVHWNTVYYGQLEPPALDPAGPVTIPQGELMQAEIINGEHAAFYAWLTLEDGSYTEDALILVNGSRVTATTENLIPGTIYVLHVRSSEADYGYEGSTDEAALRFTVTEPQTAESLFITASAETVIAGESVLLSACVPGSEETYIFLVRDGAIIDEQGSYGERTVWVRAFDEAGEYTFHAGYCDESTNYDRMLTDASVTVTVKPKDPVPQPDVEAAHRYTAPEIIREATCIQTGLRIWHCEYNDEHYKEEIIPINPDAHEWDEGSVTRAATCTEAGEITYTCLRDSSHTRTEPIAAIGHDFDLENPTVTKEAACTEEGEITYPCLHGCGETLKRTIPAHGHLYDEEHSAITKDPTCTQAGIRTYYCVYNEAHDTRTERIPATGHRYGEEFTVTKEPTCEEEGIRTCTCLNDPGHIRTETVEALGHEWNEGIRTEPTCTEQGKIVYTCRHDPSHTRTEILSPLGHEWAEEGRTAREAACGVPGLKEYPCTRDGCGEKLTESIPALEHRWGTARKREEPTCEKEGEVYVECENGCGARRVLEILEKVPHAWDGGTVTRPATTASAGIMTYTCAVCGEKKEESIPKINGDPVMTILPSSLTRIEESAFEGSSLEAVTIPTDCTYIGRGAFRNCGSLVRVVFLNDETEIDEDAFDESSGIVFRCRPGSRAEIFAGKHGFRTEPME